MRSWKVSGAALAVLMMVGCAQEAPPASEPGRAIEAAEVRPEDVIDVVSSVGRVEAKRQVAVNAELPEVIETVHVELGQEVVKGQPLVTLGGQLQAAGLGQAEASLEAARASRELARQQAERVQVLFDAGTVSKADLDAARSQLTSAEAQVRQLGSARTQAAVQRSRTVVRAPFDGVVAQLDASEGDMAQPGRPLAVLVQPGPMKVLLDVPEREFVRIRRGQRSRVGSLAAPTERVEGTVKAVGLLIDPMTRTGRVEIEVPQSALLPGSAVRAAVETDRREDALVVPVLAVQLRADFEQSHKATVYEVGEGVAIAQEVRLGERLGDRYEVVEGLEPGDVVATLGAHLLEDGAPVRVMETVR